MRAYNFVNIHQISYFEQIILEVAKFWKHSFSFRHWFHQVLDSLVKNKKLQEFLNKKNMYMTCSFTFLSNLDCGCVVKQLAFYFWSNKRFEPWTYRHIWKLVGYNIVTFLNSPINIPYGR